MAAVAMTPRPGTGPGSPRDGAGLPAGRGPLRAGPTAAFRARPGKPARVVTAAEPSRPRWQDACLPCVCVRARVWVCTNFESHGALGVGAVCPGKPGPGGPGQLQEPFVGNSRNRVANRRGPHRPACIAQTVTLQGSVSASVSKTFHKCSLIFTHYVQH